MLRLGLLASICLSETEGCTTGLCSGKGCCISDFWVSYYCPVYSLVCPLSADQTFDKCKYKITPDIYLGMYPIYARTVALTLIMSTGRVSTQLHVAFDPSFTTINRRDGNLFLPREW